MTEKSKCGVVILAAGPSKRMEGADKVYGKLLGRSALTWPVATFESHPAVSKIAIVVSKGNVGWVDRLRKSENWGKVSEICEGGARRQDSAREGLKRLQGVDVAIVHDGARACVSSDIITRGLSAVKATGAAVAAVRMTDNVRVVNERFEVVGSYPKEGSWIIQTPQLFSYDLIMKAHEAVREEVLDDASMVEKIGGKVVLFEGSYTNIMITRKADIWIAEHILSSRITQAVPRGAPPA